MSVSDSFLKSQIKTGVVFFSKVHRLNPVTRHSVNGRTQWVEYIIAQRRVFWDCLEETPLLQDHINTRVYNVGSFVHEDAINSELTHNTSQGFKISIRCCSILVLRDAYGHSIFVVWTLMRPDAALTTRPFSLLCCQVAIEYVSIAFIGQFKCLTVYFRECCLVAIYTSCDCWYWASIFRVRFWNDIRLLLAVLM